MPRPSSDDPLDDDDFADVADPDLAAAGEDDDGDFEDFDPAEDDEEE